MSGEIGTNESAQPFKRQTHKMVKHTQTIWWLLGLNCKWKFQTMTKISLIHTNVSYPEVYLETTWISTIEPFCGNSEQLFAFTYFCK